MIEQWKEIQGNRETYLISNLGNVKTKARIGARGYNVKSHTLTKTPNSTGYLRVSMNIDGKNKAYFVHRLVATLFVDKIVGKDFVNHIDGNKQNNCANNLEWCTRSENEQHAWKTGLKRKEMCSRKGEQHGCHKLTQKQVDYIRRVHKPYDKNYGSVPLAKRFNVNPQTITDVSHYRTWEIEKLPYSELITGEKNNG